MRALLITLALAAPALAEEQSAIFAGGCFWCTEADFDKVDGVTATISGYTGGDVDTPTYYQVVGGGTGHREAVLIRFDSSIVSYRELVDIFWRTVDVTDDGGQFCDRGFSYTTAVFALNDAQRANAEASKAEAEAALGTDIVTPVLDAATFYQAEGFHQDYYTKNPLRYATYRRGCGRDRTLEQVWGDEALTN